jgi:hypothetical protein
MWQTKEASEDGAQDQVPKAGVGMRGAPVLGAREPLKALELWSGQVTWFNDGSRTGKGQLRGLAKAYLRSASVSQNSLWALRFRAEGNSGVS